MPNYEGEVPEREKLEGILAEALEKEASKPGGYPYADHAPTGRATCIVTGEKIPKGSVRVAVEREIERIAGGAERPLRHDLAGRLDRHAGPEVEAGGVCGFARGALTGDASVLIGERGEIGTIALEAGGADVGEVVGDDAHARILCLEPGAGDLKG